MKLQYEGVIGTIFREYTLVFLFVALAQFSYIFLIYFLLSGCRAKEFIRLVKNMLPATISGFSTMSSAVSLPVTLIGVERNTTHKEVADAVVPTTVNIHLVGDSFAITIFAYAVLKSFGMDEPSFLTYLMFAGYFVLAKFSVAAVPGGGILVMLPILENHLGFQGAMLSMITGLFILFDSVSTAANVLGNGAFAKVVDNCMVWFKGRRKTSP
jgi:Na+/H+-dicarboxylate symporter